MDPQGVVLARGIAIQDWEATEPDATPMLKALAEASIARVLLDAAAFCRRAKSVLNLRERGHARPALGPSRSRGPPIRRARRHSSLGMQAPERPTTGDMAMNYIEGFGLLLMNFIGPAILALILAYGGYQTYFGDAGAASRSMPA